MRKALIVAPSWIGDTILAQPLFKRLHEKHPGLILDAFAPAWAAPVLARMREVRRVIPNPFAHGEFNLAGRWRAGRELAREGYDAAIVLPNSWKSALLPFFAGIPQRIGFKGEARHVLLNRIHRARRRPPCRSWPQRYALLAEEIGATAPAPLAAAASRCRRATACAPRSPRTASLPRRPRSSSARARNTARPSAGRRRISPNSARRLAEADFPVWIVGSAKDAPDRRGNRALLRRRRPQPVRQHRSRARPSTCSPARGWW